MSDFLKHIIVTRIISKTKKKYVWVRARVRIRVCICAGACRMSDKMWTTSHLNKNKQMQGSEKISWKKKFAPVLLLTQWDKRMINNRRFQKAVDLKTLYPNNYAFQSTSISTSSLFTIANAIPKMVGFFLANRKCGIK